MIYPASVTPLTPAGEIDMAGVVRLVSWFRAAGVDGILVAGTNGEGPSLSAVEKRDLLKQAISVAQGTPVVLGIATNAISEAIWLTEQAAKAGAEAALIMPPGFFKESGQPGLIAWFQAILERASLPVWIYNFPQRTGVRIEPDTFARLAEHAMFGGVKDSSGEAENIDTFARILPGKRLFVGDENLYLEARRGGWTGAISGATNILCSWLVQIDREWPSDPESAETKFELILPSLRALRDAPQPYTNKEILRRLGVLETAQLKPPLQPKPGEKLEMAAKQAMRMINR